MSIPAIAQERHLKRLGWIRAFVTPPGYLFHTFVNQRHGTSTHVALNRMNGQLYLLKINAHSRALTRAELQEWCEVDLAQGKLMFVGFWMLSI